MSVGGLGSGHVIGQLDQSYDENIKIKQFKGKFENIAEAKKAAKEAAASDTEDSVIVKEVDEAGKEWLSVYTTDEVGKLDASGNAKEGSYKIHDLNPVSGQVVDFEITARDKYEIPTREGEVSVTPSSAENRDAKVNTFVTRVMNKMMFPEDIKEKLVGGKGLDTKDLDKLIDHCQKKPTVGLWDMLTKSEGGVTGTEWTQWEDKFKELKNKIIQTANEKEVNPDTLKLSLTDIVYESDMSVYTTSQNPDRIDQ